MGSARYKVYITPRSGENTYGDEYQVDAEIAKNGLKVMKKSIDSSDYDVGVYVFGDITLKILNKDGIYGDETDARSIFCYSRDLAKVRVVYSDAAGEIDRFHGLINEDATREDFDSEMLEFRVLSNSSVIRTTKIAGGLVTSGILSSVAIGSILNQSKITSVLNFNASDVNVDIDVIVDDGSVFDNLAVSGGLDKLLLATNSVMIIDESDNIIIKSRAETSKDILSLYGPYDEKARQNITSLKKYNSGKHRTFSSVRVNDEVETDNGFTLDFGFRQKKISLDFISDVGTSRDIAERILREFRVPKFEVEVAIPTRVARDVELLDRVSLNYPLRVKRVSEKFLPIVGDTKIGDSEMPLPASYGNNSIPPEVAFKVVAIAENPKNFETVLKLRQMGVSTGDGYFTNPESSIIGFAKIGSAPIGGTGTACDKYSVAYLGGARIGCTKVV